MTTSEALLDLEFTTKVQKTSTLPLYETTHLQFDAPSVKLKKTRKNLNVFDNFVRVMFKLPPSFDERKLHAYKKNNS